MREAEGPGDADPDEFLHGYVERNANRISWLKPVFDLCLGNAEPSDALVAGRHNDRKTQAERTAAVSFYVGQWHMLRGEPDLAWRNLERCRESKLDYLPEVLAAEADLKRNKLEEKVAGDG